MEPKFIVMVQVNGEWKAFGPEVSFDDAQKVADFMGIDHPEWVRIDPVPVSVCPE